MISPLAYVDSKAVIGNNDDSPLLISIKMFVVETIV